MVVGISSAAVSGYCNSYRQKATNCEQNFAHVEDVGVRLVHNSKITWSFKRRHLYFPDIKSYCSLGLLHMMEHG